MHFFIAIMPALFLSLVTANGEWSALVTLAPDNDAVNQKTLNQNGELQVTIADDAYPFTWATDGGSKIVAIQGTHPPSHYFFVNEDKSISINLQGTDGFSVEDDNIAFEGKQDFGVCEDDGRLYVGEGPSSCAQYVNVTVHSVPLT